jgi:hypothetical protein
MAKAREELVAEFPAPLLHDGLEPKSCCEMFKLRAAPEELE